MVEHPLERAVHEIAEIAGHHGAVITQVDIDNRRRPQPGQALQRRGGGQRRRQQVGQYPKGHRADVGVRGQRPPAGDHDFTHDRILPRHNAAGGAAGHYPHPQLRQLTPRRPAQGIAQGNNRVAHIGIMPPLEQPILDDHQPHGGADGADIVVQSAFHQHIPQVGDGPFRLPVRAQPVAEVNILQGRPPPVGPHRRQQAAHGPQLVRNPQVGISQKGGQQVRRRRQRRPVKPPPPAGPVIHGHIQPGLQTPPGAGPDALQKGDEVMAGAHDDVLPVVVDPPGLGVGIGVGPPPQAGAGLQQCNPPAGFRQPQGGGNAGQPAADDQGAGGGHFCGHFSSGPASQACAIRRALAPLLKAMRSRNTSQPAASIRSRTPP